MSRGRAAWVLAALALLAAAVACCGWPRLPAPGARPAPAGARAPGRSASDRRTVAAPDDAPDPGGPAGPVECELLDPVSPFARIQVVEVDPESFEVLRTAPAEVEGGWIRFTPLRAFGLGQVHVALHRPATVAWAEGTCLEAIALERLPFRVASGTIVGAVETGAVAVHARCGPGAEEPPAEGSALAWSGAVGESGAWQLEVPSDQGPCSVRATRVFGGRDLVGPWVPLGDRPLPLALPVPTGVGWGLLEVDGGLRVVGVEPGLAADLAGLQVGDLLVTVDDDPAADLAAAELAEADGPLRVEVLRGGDRRVVTVR